MVYQNNPRLAQIDNIAAAEHAAVFSVFVQNREIAVTHFCHYACHVVYRRDQRKLFNIFRCHIIGNRRALANQFCRRICIHRHTHNGNVVFIGELDNGLADLSPLTHNNQTCVHFNRAQLTFVPVGKQNNIARFHQAFHRFGVGCTQQNAAAVHDRVLIPHQHGAVQRFQNIVIGCMAFRQHSTVENIHIGRSNILNRNQSQQFTVRVNNGQGINFLVTHNLPRAPQAGIAGKSGHFTVIHVTDLRVDIRHHAWRPYVEFVQHKGGFLIQLACSARFIYQIAGFIFQFCISDC